MGMFDELRYEHADPLPDGYEGRAFQTKEFGCDMAQYKLTAEGRLMQPLDENDEVPSAWGGGSVVRYRDTHYHGWLHFYTFISDKEQPRNGKWHGYMAKFTDGQLIAVKMDDQTERAFISTLPQQEKT
jgi:hypothetical protein